jgi:hypothetical protein
MTQHDANSVVPALRTDRLGRRYDKAWGLMQKAGVNGIVLPVSWDERDPEVVHDRAAQHP